MVPSDARSVAWPIWPGTASRSISLEGGGGCGTATEGAPLDMAGGWGIDDSDMIIEGSDCIFGFAAQPREIGDRTERGRRRCCCCFG